MSTRLAKYQTFNDIRIHFSQISEHVNMNIMENLDYLTVDFEDSTRLDIIKSVQALISKNKEFKMNEYSYVKDVWILGQYKNDKFSKDPIDISPRNILNVQKLIEYYNDNGLFYRVSIMTKDGDPTDDQYMNGVDAYVPFEEESDKLIEVMKECSRRMLMTNDVTFQGVFVGYVSDRLKPKWYKSIDDIEDYYTIRNIQLYFQDKTVPKI